MHLKGPFRVLTLLYALLFTLPLLVLLTALLVPGAEGGVFIIFPFVVFSSGGESSMWILFPLLFMLLFMITTLYVVHLLFRLPGERSDHAVYERGDRGEGSRRVPSEGSEEVGTTGIILLGPIPIIFSASRGGSSLLLILPLILALLLLGFIGILFLIT